MNPVARKSKIAIVGGTTAVILLSCFVFLSRPSRKVSPDKVFRVGADHSPPFYYIGPDGSVTGLAVDVVNEAAKRRGIRLIWVPVTGMLLDDALTSRTVDLWPLVGTTRFRQDHFFVSQPWMENEYILVSLDSHPVRNAADAAGRLIAHAKLKGAMAVALQYLPWSKFLVKPHRLEAVQSVCSGEAAAAVVENRVLDAMLLEGVAGCEGKRLKMATLAGARAPLSLVAIPEARFAAEQIREEISHLAKDGFLAGRLDEWCPFSAAGTRSIWDREAAEHSSRVYGTFLCVILVCSVGLVSVARRALVLKRAAQRAERELREIQRRFTAFMDHSPAVTFMRDLEGRYLYTNAMFAQIFGAGEGQPPKKPELMLLEDGLARQDVEFFPDAGGRDRYWLSVRFPFTAESGQRFVGGTCIDITEREEARQQLAASEARYRDLVQQQQRTLAELQASEQRWQLALNGAGDGLWDWDMLSGTVFRSPGWKIMLGYQETEIGQALEDWSSRLHPDDIERVQADLEDHLRKRTPAFACDYRIRAKDGSWRWISDRGKAVWDECGNPLRITGSQSDITARKLEQETLSLEARTDSLTGLWNRREFDSALSLHSEIARASGRPLSICVFDLDCFKSVNDTHGHAAGDQALIKFGFLLRENLRRGDINCRIGGDEFVTILPDTASEVASVLAERVSSSLRLFRFKSQTEVEFRVRCSFGVGEFGAPDMLAAADELLYRAKQKSRKQLHVA